MRFGTKSRSGLPVIVSLFFLGALLAGCIVAEDDMKPENGEANAGTGATIEGRVLTVGLDPVFGARVALVHDGDLVKEARTSDQGDYSLSGLDPGEYRIQVTAPCCREYVQGVSVQKDAQIEVSVQLEPFTQADLQAPFSITYDWTGFYTCGAGTPVITWSTCATIEDPNHDWSHGWDVGENLKSTVIAMDWNPVGGASGDKLMIIYECWDECSGEHARASGEPPLELRADGFPDGEWHAGYRVFPPFEFTVTYQQEFTVYWEEFYHRAAPDGHSALPDN